MRETYQLLVPPGILQVEDCLQEIYIQGPGGSPVLAGAWLTCRTAYLNGQLLPWSPASRDLLRAAADALAGIAPAGFRELPGEEQH